MADTNRINRPLTRDSVRKAHERIKPYIHLTPVLTCTTLTTLASTPQNDDLLAKSKYKSSVTTPSSPKINLFFKCENYQKVGAFKARGAFHALSCLTDGELSDGVVTHSSGNHAQALAYAASVRGVPAYIVMPTISTPSKIAATKGYGAEVIFSGSTSVEREAVTKEVIARTGARLVPPYDHPDIILGQGTTALEFETQVKELGGLEKQEALEMDGWGWRTRMERRRAQGRAGQFLEGLDAVIVPTGGGGLLSGVATALSGTGVAVFAAEPEFEGANDLQRGLAESPPTRIESVSTLTIADGLRTPIGQIPWGVISDKTKVRGAFSVTEDQIKAAMKLLFERMKIMVEPSAAVGLAVALFDEDFRRLVEREAGDEGWNVGIILTGGNTTMEAIGKLFQASDENHAERQQGILGLDNTKTAENVAG